MYYKYVLRTYTPYPCQSSLRLYFSKWFLARVKFIMFKKVDIWTNIILKKNHKNLTLNFKWGAIQEWGCIDADTVVENFLISEASVIQRRTSLLCSIHIGIWPWTNSFDMVSIRVNMCPRDTYFNYLGF